jgi:hypothetical protein
MAQPLTNFDIFLILKNNKVNCVCRQLTVRPPLGMVGKEREITQPVEELTQPRAGAGDLFICPRGAVSTS